MGEESKFMISYPDLKRIIGDLCKSCDDPHNKEKECLFCPLDLFEDIIGELYEEVQKRKVDCVIDTKDLK